MPIAQAQGKLRRKDYMAGMGEREREREGGIGREREVEGKTDRQRQRDRGCLYILYIWLPHWI